MVMINRATKEMTFKVVYYGPGLCGKTTNLEYIYSSAHPDRKGKLLTVATETDRTLFFDFLPMELGTIRGMKVRVQLYTVPGQVFYDATRRIVLRGSDGVVFVADSQRVMMDANIESLDNLKTNLRLNSLDPDTVPLALQYNKQDLPDAATQEELDAKLNWRHVPSFLSVATTGLGVNETLKKVIELVIRKLQAADAQFGGREAEASQRTVEKEPAPVPVQTPAPIPVEEEAPEPPRQVQAAKPSLPEVELDEDGSPTFGEDDEMEAVEIETLQDVEPLPIPAGASRSGEPPVEGLEPASAGVRPGGEAAPSQEPETPVIPEPEVLEISEAELEPLDLPTPEPERGQDMEAAVAAPPVDLEILRAALAALQERVEAVAARARDLDGEAQAMREQIETVNKHLLG